ncbi:MAG: efflux RND transporter periplasmic adaptor subunit [Vicinamibacteria bacterium]
MKAMRNLQAPIFSRVHAAAARAQCGIYTVGGVGLLVGFLLVGCGGAPAPDEIHGGDHDPNVVEVAEEAQINVGLETASAQRSTLQHAVRATGIVSPDQTRYAHITPLGRGIVERVHVNLGDRVQRGEPLVSYDNIELGDLIGEYMSLQAGLTKLQAEREVARKILDRAESLLEVEAIAHQEYEVREAEYEQAAASVGSQQAEIARVEEKLHRFGLTDEDIAELETSPHESPHRTASHNALPAPFNGVIVKYDVSPGELVDRDQSLFTLVDTSSVWVLADVYEKDIGVLQAGGECQVEVSSYPNEVFRGNVTYISDFLDPASRTAKVRCIVENPDGRLKLEMFADVRIPSRARDALTIPVSALQEVNNQTVVFVRIGAAGFEKRVLEVGDQGEEWAEVLRGLDEGEEVVTKGSFYLKSILLREQIGDEH